MLTENIRIRQKQREIISSIVESLAIKGPLTTYALIHSIKVENKNSVYRWVNRMKKDGLIYVYNFANKESKRYPIYSITPAGLVQILSNQSLHEAYSKFSEKMWNRIGDIAKHNPHLAPILFEFWYDFKRAGIDIENMLKSTKPLQLSQVFLYGRADLNEEKQLQMDLDAIDRWFVSSLMALPRDQYLKFLNVINQRPEAIKKVFELQGQLLVFQFQSALESLYSISIGADLMDQPTIEKFRGQVSKMVDVLEKWMEDSKT